jgi:hypothetical protein
LSARKGYICVQCGRVSGGTAAAEEARAVSLELDITASGAILTPEICQNMQSPDRLLVLGARTAPA